MIKNFLTYCSEKSSSGGSNLIGLLSTLMSSPLLLTGSLKIIKKNDQCSEKYRKWVPYCFIGRGKSLYKRSVRLYYRFNFEENLQGKTH